MNITKKYILGSILLSILAIVLFVTIGIFSMAEEDMYGDLVYFNQKVKNGDYIFRCNTTVDNSLSIKFTEYGIIEKSFGKVYVWDSKTTVRLSLFDWFDNGYKNGDRIKVYRTKTSDFEISKFIIEVGSNYQLTSLNKLEFITENY